MTSEKENYVWVASEGKSKCRGKYCPFVEPVQIEASTLLCQYCYKKLHNQK